jgi:hypothetical protein
VCLATCIGMDDQGNDCFLTKIEVLLSLIRLMFKYKHIQTNHLFITNRLEDVMDVFVCPHDSIEPVPFMPARSCVAENKQASPFIFHVMSGRAGVHVISQHSLHSICVDTCMCVCVYVYITNYSTTDWLPDKSYSLTRLSDWVSDEHGLRLTLAGWLTDSPAAKAFFGQARPLTLSFPPVHPFHPLIHASSRQCFPP